VTPIRFQVTSLLMPSPPNGKRVMRPSRWGNPFPITDQEDAATVGAKFRQHLAENPEVVALGRRQLRWFGLGCISPLEAPCHADVWLKVVNS
jgi:hypothetical protein